MTQEWSEATQLQHVGNEYRLGKGLTPALETSVTYQSESVEDEPIYARLSNTMNHREVETLLARLHLAEDCAVFGSGMAAMASILATFTRPGDHVLFQENCYETNRGLLQKIFGRFGVESTGAAIERWGEHLRPQTRLVLFETISNPFCEPQDVSKAIGLARGHGALSVCDNTFASPAFCKPHALGADLVLESATKYLNGHADLVAGMVAGSRLHLKAIRETALYLGGFLSTTGCVQLLRGLRTFRLRMEAHQRNGMGFAQAMRQKPFVEKVYYGPNEDRAYLNAQFPAGFGGMCTIRFKKSVDVRRLMRQFKLIKDVPSLGSTETTACMPLYTTHKWTSEGDKRKLGVDDTIVRFSLGIESLEDVVSDVENAVARVQ